MDTVSGSLIAVDLKNSIVAVTLRHHAPCDRGKCVEISAYIRSFQDFDGFLVGFFHKPVIVVVRTIPKNRSFPVQNEVERIVDPTIS